ncbi:hypothetical protein C1645_812880 [Glomus cerebriforme]|uniref:MULE transposase domain-containing protein n=1 Tax=Glomus cerebriforme TaxID=658196 RepID=A0A397TTB3_9GLOM|nr:hypothetical protein C1645_812880 [Glomus cerebriforme]
MLDTKITERYFAKDLPFTGQQLYNSSMYLAGYACPLIKAVFGETVLSDIHASMNNIDKLRNIIMKEQKLLHPCYGPEYVSKFKYFMVDMSYKRVFGEINELEFNAYDEDNNSVVTFCRIYSYGSNAKVYQCMFTAFFKVYEDLTGEKPSFYYFNPEKKDGLLLLLTLIKIHFERNIRNSKYLNENKSLMRQLPKAKTKDDVNFLFEQLQIINYENINDWINEYKTPWILASLNRNYSLMDYDVWRTTPFDTKVFECSHSNVSKEGTRLRLKTTIFHSWNYDLTLYKRFHNNHQYNVPMSSRNKSEKNSGIEIEERKEELERKRLDKN